MKLSIIYEETDEIYQDSINEFDKDTISLQQSTVALRTNIMQKLRELIYNMGLTKGKEKNRVIEPIPQAVAPFDRLRREISKKLDVDIDKIEKHGLDSNISTKIQQYWGYTLPTGWNDLNTSQMGNISYGKFDALLDNISKQSENMNTKEKIELLNNLI